jgi:hypothetical protein
MPRKSSVASTATNPNLLWPIRRLLDAIDRTTFIHKLLPQGQAGEVFLVTWNNHARLLPVDVRALVIGDLRLCAWVVWSRIEGRTCPTSGRLLSRELRRSTDSSSQRFRFCAPTVCLQPSPPWLRPGIWPMKRMEVRLANHRLRLREVLKARTSMSGRGFPTVGRGCRACERVGKCRVLWAGRWFRSLLRF